MDSSAGEAGECGSDGIAPSVGREGACDAATPEAAENEVGAGGGWSIGFEVRAMSVGTLPVVDCAADCGARSGLVDLGSPALLAGSVARWFKNETIDEIAAGEFGLTGLDALLGIEPSSAERMAREADRSAPVEVVPSRGSSSEREMPEIAEASAVSGAAVVVDLDAVGLAGTSDPLPEDTDADPDAGRSLGATP